MKAGTVIAGLVFLCGCAMPEDSELQSYQSRTDTGYVYMLSHTAPLNAPPADAIDTPIGRDDFDKYGSCFYKVVSDNKLRLHRQDDLQRALAEAELVSSNYIPLTELWQQFRQQRDLQELYTSSRHWIYPVIGGVGVGVAISLVDSVLHRGNGVIVKNSAEHVIKGIEGERGLRKQTLATLHAVADAEHASDEFARKFATVGKHNPLRRLNKLLMDNRFSQGLAKLLGKTCVGRVKAAACLIGYLVTFNSMFVVGLPFGSDRLGNMLARWRNRTTEDSILSDLLGDRHSLTNTHSTSAETMQALSKIARLSSATTPACPARLEMD